MRRHEPVDREFAADVEYYLTQQPRQLPSRYLYDALGSALFDAICELPWYAVTRAELGLLSQHGGDVFGHAHPVSRIVELGPGNGSKLATLVKAAREGDGRPAEAGRYVLENDERSAETERYGFDRHLDLHLVDVSEAALSRAIDALTSLDDVDVVGHAEAYEAGLLNALDGADAGRTLALFLGSNIGNFDPPSAAALLGEIRAALGAGGWLLLGADLVKPWRVLVRAYDDPLGVTAAFNKNLLVRINRELDGEVDLDAFSHRAVWNAEASRVEMHLVSARRQQIRVAAAGLDFEMEAGETIWTESSYKYEPAAVKELLERAGFRPVEQWVAREERFALTLARAR